ncbi:G-protein beta WD-40 repeats containing protein, partial [Reticulomyxa filosa]
GSWDKTIRIWDIETTKQLNLFKGHEHKLMSVKYGPNGSLLNTVLSGSQDKTLRLWDIRSDKQIQIFHGHTDIICAVDYLPFMVKNTNKITGCNVICSGSRDNTIRFWDVRSNKNELYAMKGDDKTDGGILCLKFIKLKKKENDNMSHLYLGIIYFYQVFFLKMILNLFEMKIFFVKFFKGIINKNEKFMNAIDFPIWFVSDFVANQTNDIVNIFLLIPVVLKKQTSDTVFAFFSSSILLSLLL